MLLNIDMECRQYLRECKWKGVGSGAHQTKRDFLHAKLTGLRQRMHHKIMMRQKGRVRQIEKGEYFIMNRPNIWISVGISVGLIAAGIWVLSYFGFGYGYGYGHGGWPMGHMMGGYGGMMGYGYGQGNGGYGNAMGFVPLVFWGVIILAIALVAVGVFSRSYRNPGGQHNFSGDSLEILRQRYARGEINQEEFESKRRDLST